MRLMTGTKPKKEDLPGHPGCWVKVRKMRRSERNQYAELAGAEAADYLLRCSVVDFLLPGDDDERMRANPEDVEARMEQLEEADEELEDWLLEQCHEINGHRLTLELLRMARKGLPVDDKVVKEVGDRMRREEEARRGNSAASPAPTGVGEEESTED